MLQLRKNGEKKIKTTSNKINLTVQSEKGDKCLATEVK